MGDLSKILYFTQKEGGFMVRGWILWLKLVGGALRLAGMERKWAEKIALINNEGQPTLGAPKVT